MVLCVLVYVLALCQLARPPRGLRTSVCLLGRARTWHVVSVQPPKRSRPVGCVLMCCLRMVSFGLCVGFAGSNPLPLLPHCLCAGCALVRA